MKNKRITIGILAHVDAGKTTLSEALLYHCGAIRKAGRVDHGDTFLDTDAIEKKRGITVFSKQAEITVGDLSVTFIDTPGHADFSAETERALLALDYAILVISAPEGVQSHTRTLFSLLASYDIPAFIAVNKMDIAAAPREKILAHLKDELSPDCFDLTDELPYEDIATVNESMLDLYMENATIPDESIARAITGRALFPVVFLSALKQDGITQLTEILERFSLPRSFGDSFGARVYKIMRDDKGQRLTFLKITGGTLKVKDEILPYGAYPDEAEKVNELRRYSGDKYDSLSEASAGETVAVTGLSESYPGRGYGCEKDAALPQLLPVLSYRVLLSEEQDAHTIYADFAELADEDPLLGVAWNERLKEIRLSVMGKIQLEILRQKMEERFGEVIDFDVGNIVYKETIAMPTMGHGHYEPLKHFADVLIKMEPLPSDSGIVVKTELSTDVLPKNYQNQILNRLSRRPLFGILTDSALTDVQITLVGGKSHKKHTEGGDFRRATELAVRDALLRCQSVLLEPFYDVTLTLPAAHIGRAMADFERMKGTVASPVAKGDMMILEGKVPVRFAGDYAAEVTAYTGGMGTVWMRAAGYFPAVDADDIIEEIGYDFKCDPNRPYISVYVHGISNESAAVDAELDRLVGKSLVAKNEDVSDSAAGFGPGESPGSPASSQTTKKKKNASLAEDDELMAIFTKTFGAIKRPTIQDGARTISKQENIKRAREEYLASHKPQADRAKAPAKKKKYVLIDGYNVIFAWPDLKTLAGDNLDSARDALTDILIDYQGFTGAEVIAVFDAYKVKNNPGSVMNVGKVHIVFTKEAQTADAYIERATHEIIRDKDADVAVVTSDGLVQLIVIGAGARRISSREFEEEVRRIRREGMEGII
ncbi:MAG: TetM/TetW/TetO/TetS family tetracycline resistance ribosomal protection protein [Lachnospiraceae bacterium]|nr:TetM/TetW/TetO/TetS family tetracycline resistance ribosomal protection protein [Lachnospiraceae bacterium]